VGFALKQARYGTDIPRSCSSVWNDPQGCAAHCIEKRPGGRKYPGLTRAAFTKWGGSANNSDEEAESRVRMLKSRRSSPEYET
jgi:hypothetical protein